MSFIKSPRLTLFCIYASGLLQGFLLESIPASSSIIKSSFGLSSENYGQLFIGQLAGVLIGVIIGTICANSQRWTKNLTSLLALSVLAQALSQSGLIAAQHLPLDFAFIICLAGAFCFGFGFGLSAPPINTLPGILFPKKPDAALLVMHSLIGIGLAASPWLIGYTIAQHSWPFLQSAMLISGLVLSILLMLSEPVADLNASKVKQSIDTFLTLFKSPALWIFLAIAVCYALAEGTLNNWAVLYLTELKKLDATQSTQVLSAFWAALAIGRMGMAGLLLVVPARLIWIILPLFIVASFMLIPTIPLHDMHTATILYVIAGLGCSAAFPLSIRFAINHFASHAETMASLMTAALMIGICGASYVLGPLQKLVSLNTLIQYSAIWPLLMIGLSIWTLTFKKSALENIIQI